MSKPVVLVMSSLLATLQIAQAYQLMNSQSQHQYLPGQAASLKVPTQPVMSPFSFPENLEEGMRASVMCSVVAGDGPITISWFKDGEPVGGTADAGGGNDVKVSSLRNIRVVPITEFVSSLVINNLSREHAGNYTCRVNSSVGAINQTATMRVRAKPFFVLKPATMTTIAGSVVKLDCVADGWPTPIIRWKVTRPENAMERMASSSQIILSSPRIHVMENGSLIIKAVQVEDAGSYTCEASNGVGDRKAETDAELHVFEAPTVHTQLSVISVRKGEDIRATCSASGSPTIQIIWLKNGQQVMSGHRSVIQESDPSSREKISTLTIRNSVRNESGVYSCRASNFYGTSSTNVRVLVQEPPDAPSDLHVLEISARSVSLSWTIDFDGNSPINGYEVHFKRRDDKWPNSKMMFVSAATTNAVVLNGLQPASEYNIRLRAGNALGKSQFSSELSVTTSIEAPQSIPANISCLATGSKSLKLGWQSVPESTIIDGYYVGLRPAMVMSGLTAEPFTFRTVHKFESEPASRSKTIGPAQQSVHMNNFTPQNYEHSLDSLRRGTSYVLIVQAFNSKGTGPASHEITCETFAFDPPETPMLRLDTTTHRTATVSWTVAPQDEENIAGFELSTRNDNEPLDTWESARIPRGQRKHTLTSLACGNKYAVRIKALSDVGPSRPSDKLRFSTQGRPPIATDSRSFISSNISHVTLRLSAWMDAGCPIEHFSVQYKPRSTNQWFLLSNHIVAEQGVATITGLIPGSWYDLLVVAKNEAGITEANYAFATLTENGATVAPLQSETQASSGHFEAIMVILPAACAVMVLCLVGCVGLYLMVSKPAAIDTRNQDERASRMSLNHGSCNKSLSKSIGGCGADSIYDGAQVYFGNSVYGPTLNSGPCEVHSGHVHQEPYATNECIPPDYGFSSIETVRFVARKEISGADGPGAGGVVGQNGSHVYDVPHRRQNHSNMMGTPSNDLDPAISSSWRQTQQQSLMSSSKSRDSILVSTEKTDSF